MILKQYYLGCLAHASYLIGDEQSETAVVVDPQRDVDQYLHDAQEAGLQIQYVFLTHFHADFVAGHLELRNRAGATVCLSGKADATYKFRAFSDGEVLDLGSIRLQILETPGHTPEGICILVYDLQKSVDSPHAVLTGDTLFIGDVGRPDLMASSGVTAEELAGMLYDSLHNKLLKLPDDTLVYPAHGAGSMCGKNLSSDTVSSIGVQRMYNYALQPMSREEFIEVVTADQPDAPGYFSYDAMLNRKEHVTLRRVLDLTLNPMDLEKVLRCRQRGGQILDVRDPADFAGAHLNDSINIPLSGQFATWAGIILNRSKPIMIISDPGKEEEATLRLGRIGLGNVLGYLEGGMQTLQGRPDLLVRSERMTCGNVWEELSKDLERPAILDVRRPAEYREAHIEGSLNIPLHHLSNRVEEVPVKGRVVVHCAGGYRSSIAVSMLQRTGRTNICDMVGGISAWKASGLKTVAG